MSILTAAKSATMTDKTIAMDMLFSSTAALQGLCTATAATTCPDLKRLFEDFLTQGLQSHEAIATYTADREWSKPMAAPDDQLKIALSDADGLIGMKM